jgi:hypothetical protein
MRSIDLFSTESSNRPPKLPVPMKAKKDKDPKRENDPHLTTSVFPFLVPIALPFLMPITGCQSRGGAQQPVRPTGQPGPRRILHLEFAACRELPDGYEWTISCLQWTRCPAFQLRCRLRRPFELA